MILSEHFSGVASKNGAKAALRYLGKDITYNQIKIEAARLSYLYQNELGKTVKTARVAFLTRNSPSIITTFFALTNNRVPILFIDPEMTIEEMSVLLKESKATHLAVTNDLLSQARALLREAHLNLPVFEIEKKHGGEYDTSYSSQADHKPLDTDTALLVRSSGGSGQPKFAKLSHKQIHHALAGMRGLYRLAPDEKIGSTMNWAHAFAFVHHALFPIFMGATCVIDHGLVNAEYLDFLAESRITRIVGTPPGFLRLLISCKNEKRLLPGIKAIVVGLGPLLPEVKKTYDLLKISVCHTYGQVENVWTIGMEEFPIADASDTKSAKNPDKEYKIGRVGRGLAGLKYKVIDPQGDTIEGDGIRRGLLCVSGPTVMTGYLDLEIETKQKLRGSWLYTGDMAELEGKDDSLQITYLGRKEDYLENAGMPITLHQIDRVVKKNHLVQDAASFIISRVVNPSERVLACAVVKPEGSLLTDTTILDLCRSELPEGLVPKTVVFTDVIPRDAGGCVLGARLRGQFSGAAG